jgi:AcrR family transcriptional regulator
LPHDDQPAASRRERQKAKTRAAIQHQALRLFREQGYEATTIEQIAEAAEVAPSTCFRYFPAKEDLVLTDDYDPLIVEAFGAQPPGLGPVEAVRRALREVLGGLTEDELADMHDRAELALAVPELRAATLDQFAQTIRQITDLITRQTGRADDDFPVRNLAGAILGVMISAEFYWAEHPGSNLVALLDDALAHLESGLPL